MFSFFLENSFKVCLAEIELHLHIIGEVLDERPETVIDPDLEAALDLDIHPRQVNFIQGKILTNLINPHLCLLYFKPNISKVGFECDE